MPIAAYAAEWRIYMSNEKPIRGALFGGFNKKDVAAYIEEMSRRTNEYKAENERLLENSYVVDAYASLQEEHEALAAELEALKAENTRLAEENAALAAELESIKADSEAYKAAREQLVALELDANRRAIELERTAKAKADSILGTAGESVVELQATMESIRRDALRMKENLHAQITGIESSIDDLAALSRSKQEFLGKYIPRDN